jgi:hypothetical protein
MFNFNLGFLKGAPLKIFLPFDFNMMKKVRYTSACTCRPPNPYERPHASYPLYIKCMVPAFFGDMFIKKDWLAHIQPALPILRR